MTNARPLARILAALVLAAQATLPIAATLAEDPQLPAAHEAHLSAHGAADCEPPHDELHCLLCRVLSGHSLPGAVPPVASAAEADVGTEPDRFVTPAATAGPSLHHARAPPIS